LGLPAGERTGAGHRRLPVRHDAEGGTYGHGTLFKISTTGDITILKHFNYYAEGGNPKGSLIQATDGNFYGMLNGSSTYSGGAIFKMTPGGQFSIVKNLSLRHRWRTPERPPAASIGWRLLRHQYVRWRVWLRYHFQTYARWCVFGFESL
jgi:hypothetical protein